MAYYFMVEKKKGDYESLDIAKSKYFVRMSKFKGIGCSLSEIDLFTMMFNNETEMRETLIKEEILPEIYSLKSLSIRLLKDKKYHKVMYDFLFQKDMEYVMEPKLLITRINNKLRKNDLRFIESFVKTFMNFYDCSSTAPEIYEYITSSIRNGVLSPRLFELDENSDTILIRMTKLLIYDYYQGYNGKVVYKETIKYRNLHSIIAFINYYDKKHQMEDVFPLNKELCKTKKKTKHSTIDGQTSLF